MREMLEDSIQRLLADHVTPQALRQAETGEWPQALWALIEDNGFTQALVSEEAGGSGLAWADVYPVVVAAGQHALPLPLPETMLAAWLLDRAGIAVPGGAIGICDCAVPLRFDGAEVTGALDLVPWGRHVAHVVASAEIDGATHIVLLATAGLPRADDLNLAREPRDSFTLDACRPVASAPWPAELGPQPMRHYGALLRCAQMAGAMEQLVAQSIRYAGERVQFGKAIGKFQAIQQQLAVLGCESAATAAGAAFAFEQAGGPSARLAIAAAKQRASEAAGQAASIAHATHGAIGFTYEHTLHFSTRRLWSWRSEFGHQGWWAQRIGAAACAAGADHYWAGITATRLPWSAPA